MFLFSQTVNKWLEQVRPLTECHAYTNDVKCATKMEKTNDCKGKGKDSDCCTYVDKDRYADEAAKAPACPNFDLATVLP